MSCQNTEKERWEDREIMEVPRKVLPVFFVLDTSGSMTGRRIAVLNEAVESFLMDLVSMQAVTTDVAINVGILEYNCRCRWAASALTPVNEIIWEGLVAGGATAFGAALAELESKLCRQVLNPYRMGIDTPLIIFTTDGCPTDMWEKPMDRLWYNKWYQCATKVAIGIGDSFDYELLSKLVGSKGTVFVTPDATDIMEAFDNTLELYRRIPFGTMGSIPYYDDSISLQELPNVIPVAVENDYGRSKCKLLKSIRKTIADANNIPYTNTECHSVGHCDGACPVCDKEAAEISVLLTQKAASGQPIHMPSMETSLLDDFLPDEGFNLSSPQNEFLDWGDWD